MRTYDTAPVRASHTPRPRLLSRWRTTVLITVLAGFFLMHGLSGADACISTALEQAATQGAVVSASASGAMASTTATSASTSTEAVFADSCDCAVMGTLCVPLRPQDSALLLTLLLLGLATLPTGSAWSVFITAALRGMRGARPRSFGSTPVRVLACVSRT